MTHFLQTHPWQVFQESIGHRTFTAQGDGWRYLAVLESGPLYKRLYCPYGPSAQDTKALAAALDDLERTAREHGITYVKVEPTGVAAGTDLGGFGYQRTRWVQPEDTWVLDLDPSEDELIKGMQSTNRNRHRNAAKRGLSVRTSDDPADVSILIHLLGGVAEHNGITPHDAEYFAAQAKALFPLGAAKLYIVDLAGEDGTKKPVAASLIYDSPDTRYYAHAAADYEHRKIAPGSVIVSTMIIEAKRAGLQHFDFYGIAPENAPDDHPWKGFTSFKQSFGGRAVHYAGAWEKPIKRTQYKLYKLAHRLAKGQ